MKPSSEPSGGYVIHHVSARPLIAMTMCDGEGWVSACVWCGVNHVLCAVWCVVRAARDRQVIRSSYVGGLSSEGEAGEEEETTTKIGRTSKRSTAATRRLSPTATVSVLSETSSSDGSGGVTHASLVAPPPLPLLLARSHALLAQRGGAAPHRRIHARVSRGAPPAAADGGGDGEARGEAFARHREAQAGAARQDRGQGSSAMTEGGFSMTYVDMAACVRTDLPASSSSRPPG